MADQKLQRAQGAVNRAFQRKRLADTQEQEAKVALEQSPTHRGLQDAYEAARVKSQAANTAFARAKADLEALANPSA